MSAIATIPAVDHGPRLASYDPADFGQPTGLEEEWRFTPVDDFAAVLDGRSGAGMRCAEGPYVRAVDIADIDRSWLPTDRAGAVAHVNASSAVVVDVPAEAAIDEPIDVSLRGSGPLGFGYVIVRLGAHARATVVLEEDLERDTSVIVVVELATGANLRMASIADGPRAHVHHLHWHTRVGRDASFTGLAITLGGHRVRVLPSAHFTGPGGSATLLGACLASAGQYFEHRLFVEHDQPNCTSNVMYKGALDGQGTHTVWVGDVLVRRTGTGTDTYEVNRNLLLDDGPRADSVPNLELETGDVAGAGHASATGRFEDEQMFYLRSRGIDEATARQLVVRGFFADVLLRADVSADLTASLMARIDARLGMDASEPGDV